MQETTYSLDVSLRNSGAKCVSNKMSRRFQNVSVCSTLHCQTAEGLAETFVYYVGDGFGIPWDFAKGYDLVF